jgi:SDR family mycofactocin-dependent oxidoreductase
MSESSPSPRLMVSLKGQVAFISGIARGMGRSHAVELARQGVNIIGFDIVKQISSVRYDMSTPQDLIETVRLVEQEGSRIVADEGDVRVRTDVDRVLKAGLAEFGRLDIVIANAGIAEYASAQKLTSEAWTDVIDTDLTGVWNTVQAALPTLIDGGVGGSIVLISSVAGIKGVRNLAHYAAAKHGIVGLMKTLSLELGEHRIRVNSIHPSSVATAMVLNNSTYKTFRPDLPDPGPDDVHDAMLRLHSLPIPWVEPIDVSNAILFLVSDAGRYITGVQLPIDAGALVR